MRGYWRNYAQSSLTNNLKNHNVLPKMLKSASRNTSWLAGVAKAVGKVALAYTIYDAYTGMSEADFSTRSVIKATATIGIALLPFTGIGTVPALVIGLTYVALDLNGDVDRALDTVLKPKIVLE